MSGIVLEPPQIGPVAPSADGAVGVVALRPSGSRLSCGSRGRRRRGPCRRRTCRPTPRWRRTDRRSRYCPSGRQSPWPCCIGLRDVVVVVVLVAAELDPASDAHEVRVQDEVDDARDGVGAVDGRRAAGEDVDPLHERRRDEVQVRRRGERVASRHPAAVDQDQRALSSRGCAGPPSRCPTRRWRSSSSAR